MRKMIAVALMAGAGLVLSGAAQAGTSVDLVFQGLNGGCVGGGTGSLTCTAAQASSGVTVANVVMTTTDNPVNASFSVGFDTANGLTITQAIEWIGMSFPAVGKAAAYTFKPLQRGDGVTGTGKFTTLLASANANGTLSAFDGATSILTPVLFAASLPPGTYSLGTVTWHLGTGVSVVEALIAGGDTLAIVDVNNVPSDVTGSVVLGTGTITIVPEPGTAALLGLGLMGLMVASRRRS